MAQCKDVVRVGILVLLCLTVVGIPVACCCIRRYRARRADQFSASENTLLLYKQRTSDTNHGTSCHNGAKI